MDAGIYTQLQQEPKHIRLLHLQPSEQFDGKLEASLEAVCLDDRPVYKALSYCWGKNISPHTISVDGIEMQMTENLETALRNLRLAGESLTIWNDALCINQMDTCERNQQVAFMHMIYKYAAIVLVWLGPEADDSKLALQTIKTWATEFIVNKDTSHLFQQSRAEGLDVQSWTAIRQLLAREYWSRTWIFQEIMLGNHVVVRCGDVELDWEDFSALDEAHRQLVRKEEVMKRYLPVEQYKIKVEVEERIMQMSLFFSLDIVKEAKDPLSALLRWTSEMQCLDPRDHIYAMIGFIEQREWYPEPNYSIAPVQVFTEFARAQILRSNSLAILHDCACRSIDEPEGLAGLDLPSWVPNWTNKARLQRSVTLNHETYFNAAAGLPFNAKDVLAPQYGGLSVHGIQIDRVYRVASKSFLDVDFELPEILEFIEDLEYPRNEGGYLSLQRYYHEYPTGEPLMYVLLRTCVLDIDFRFAGRLTTMPEHADLLKEVAEGFLLRLSFDYGLLMPQNQST